MKFVESLETERLILRIPTLNDFEAFHSWCSNPENVRYMSFGPNDEDQTKEWLAQAKPGRDFAVVIKDSNAVIGSCGIYPKDNSYIGEVGWILHEDHWKRGYGTELCGELIRYGFEDLKLGRIQAPCAAANYGSYRIMERNGMRREALHRKAFWARIDREWVDEAWYAILAEDYFRNSQATKAIQATYRKAEKSDIETATDLLYDLYYTQISPPMEREELLEENITLFSDSRQGFILAYDTNTPIGIAHVSLRSEYVNGTEHGGTCGYLEAVYVKPEYRKNGIAAELVRLCEDWAKGHGCREFASDCLLHNTDSYFFHLRIGFTETERCIFFRKDI